MKQKFGVIGLAVMGENLALNIERNGFPIAVYNRSYEKTAAFVNGRAKGKNVVGAKTLAEFVQALEKPRRILIMVKAGKPVDAVIAELKPLLEPGDIMIDGGNSFYPDTDRRVTELEPTGLKFFGMGVSGGEEGALWGPSLMPGGDQQSYQFLEPILTKMSAKAEGEPCVTYVGAKSAGHFVKMVHNGIEYGDMQLIAEAYDLMRNGLKMSTAELEDTFCEWNASELQSFLIEITSKIVNFKEAGGKKALIDVILDKTGQKGTGKWTTQAALDLAVPVPTITAAVDARNLSGEKDIRVQMSKVFKGGIKPAKGSKKGIIKQIKSALYCSKITSYAQGFDLLGTASREFGYGCKIGELAKIWRGGCIIRAAFLNRITAAYVRNPNLPNLLMDKEFAKEIKNRVDDWRAAVGLSIKLGITSPATATSLAYYDCMRRERLPAYLVSAQRDYFGAHTYQRTDKEGVFHTDWTGVRAKEAAAAGGGH